MPTFRTLAQCSHLRDFTIRRVKHHWKRPLYNAYYLHRSTSLRPITHVIFTFRWDSTISGAKVPTFACFDWFVFVIILRCGATNYNTYLLFIISINGICRCHTNYCMHYKHIYTNLIVWCHICMAFHNPFCNTVNGHRVIWLAVLAVPIMNDCRSVAFKARFTQTKNAIRHLSHPV